ncbi:MAG: hypothetical protein HYU63_02625 [Armatimonadetes bacterium]|nr:hypothetical protein [Armatimonadota bacterium]
MFIERIEDRGNLIALILRKGLKNTLKDTKFFTDDNCALQIGIFKHEKGYSEPPHKHYNVKRIISGIQQVVYLEEGKMSVALYAKNNKKIKTVVIGAGDTLLLADGGHSVEALEKFSGITVKQGPYMGLKKDKRNMAEKK